MRWKKLLLIVSALLTLVIGGTASAQGGGFVEPFDDPSLPMWERIGDATVQDGTLVFHAGGGALRAGTWSDLALIARMRRIGEGDLLVHLRFSDEGALTVQIGRDFVAVASGAEVLAEASLEGPPDGEWFQLQAELTGTDLVLEIDTTHVLTATLTAVPEDGSVGFFFEGPGEGAVDFAELVDLREEPIPPQATPPSIATQAPPSSGVLTEAMVVMTEDLRNGMFDAAEATGSGQLVVEPAEDGNLAVHVSGPVDIRMHGAAWQANSWRDYDLSARFRRSASGSIGFGLRWIPLLPHAPQDTGRGYWIDHSDGQWILSRSVGGRLTELSRAGGGITPNVWHDLLVSVRDGAMGTEFVVLVDKVEVFRARDGSPIPHGGLAFRTEGGGVELWLDDLEVTAQFKPQETWRQASGPEGASGISAIAVDPRDWQVAYAGGLDAGLFKTTDGGTTWTEIGLTHELWTPRIQTLVFAPSDPRIIYAGAGAKHISPIWRSDDAGETWQWMRLHQPEGDHLANADVLSVAILPDDPLHFYFGVSSGVGPVPPEYAGVYESTDGGRTYRSLHSGGGNIGPVVLDPSNPRHILAGSLNPDQSGVSILASFDGGRTWSASEAGLAGRSIAQLVFDPHEPDTAIAVEFSLAPEVGGNVFRSQDGGKTWKTLDSHPNSISLFTGPPPNSYLYSYHPDGLYASQDSGDTWTLISPPGCVGEKNAVATDRPEVIYSFTPPTINVSADLGKTCTSSVTGLMAHPVVGLGTSASNPTVVYIGTLSGVYKSMDAGQTWVFLRPGMFAGIAVDPTDSQIVYLGAVEQRGILKSTDGGATWTSLGEQIDYPGVSTLAVDPGNPQTIFAGTGHGPQMSPQGGGLYRSLDGGASWQRLPGVPDVAVTAIEIDLSGSGRVAVATMGNGVLISEDGGNTFEPRNDGFVEDPVGRQVWALAMHPQDPDILYAGTSFHYSKAGSGGSDGLYKTTDGGQNWTMILGGEQVAVSPNGFIAMGGGVDAIAINAARPDEIYVALHDPGIVFSEDGGKSWEYVNSGLVPLMTHVYPYRMGISPSGEILYATSCGRSIFRNLTGAPEDSLKEFLQELPDQPQSASPEPESTQEASGGQPTAAPSEGGWQLPCIAGAAPVLGLAWVGRRRRRRA